MASLAGTQTLPEPFRGAAGSYKQFLAKLLFNGSINPNSRRNPDGVVAGGLLARAPKSLVVATVVVADLIFSSGLLVSTPRFPGADSAAADASCEHGSCSRQVAVGHAEPARANVPTGKPRLLEFTSRNCPSCGKMAPFVHRMERDCTAHDGTILRVDVDTGQGDNLAANYVVNELPTFIMIDSNGVELSRLVGEQPRQRLAVALAGVNGVLCTVL
jgi:cytochrome c-type biogenesis protein